MYKKKQAIPVIDLFAGVGGLSLGASRAGFKLAAAVEWDSMASATHHLNFPNCVMLKEDVELMSGEDLLSKAGLSRGGSFGIIGGPPCQGFSFMGRRDPTDPRNNLFAHFFRLVEECRPAFFVAENVPGLLAEANAVHVMTALSFVGDKYIFGEPIRIAADDLGVPTVRERIFFIGVRADVLSNGLSIDLEKEKKASTSVKVGEALRGLPMIRSDWNTEIKSWRALTETYEDSFFSESLRDRIPLGVGSQIARDALEKGFISGCLGTKHDSSTVKRFRALKPGQIDSVSKGKRLHPDGFCPTLRAGTGSEKGSYQAVRPIHFGSPRVITPREAARLQGFPDWFTFHPTKWHAFRQIGNSVSPLVAETVLRKVKAIF
jgi:DNA (cytosine-5)-methyltransferase 1